MLRHIVAVALTLLVAATRLDAFQPTVLTPTHQRRQAFQPHSCVVTPGTNTRDAWWSRQRPSLSVLSASMNNDNDNSNNNQEPEEESPSRKMSRLRRFRRRISKFAKRRLAVALFVGASMGGLWNIAAPQRAEASAPVMAVPKAEQRDPATDAMLNHERKMVAKQQQELQELNAKAREIETNEGTAARIKFEKQHKAQKDKEQQEYEEGLVQLKRDLLEQGIDPNTSVEGRRQIILYEKGLDLGKVPGTRYYMEKQLESGKQVHKSTAYKQAANRRVIKAMVQDLKNRDMDPVDYFEKHQDKTQDIMAMPPLAAAQLAQTYEANLEQYGQINIPKEGEMSAKEKMEKSGASKEKDKEALKKQKEEQKRAKAEAKAKAAAEKQRAKEEAKAAKEAQKKEKEASKAAEKAAAAAAIMAAETAEGAASTAQSVADSAVETVTSQESSTTEEDGQVDEASEQTTGDEEGTSIAKQPTSETPKKGKNTVSIGGKKIPIIPLAGAGVVAVGGGGYAFKMMQEKAALAEQERERQLRRLMGLMDDDDEDDDTSSGPSSAPALEVMESDDGFGSDPSELAPPPPKTGKKKRRGFFAKKNKNNRETDLNVLVSSEAKAPQFAALLSKILTYGAPGRFPSVDALPGEMPFTEFDLEAAKQMLVDAREDADITLEESAEVFAGVVNCMLIDIVDLASATLKAKDEKVTQEGISVVIDFMNHAASLYDSVAGGTVIEPVTYGGDLGKGQLEKMYSAYAAAGVTSMMSGMDTDFEGRLGLLQDAFQISEKKAEGIATKMAQKKMMEMMKSGDMEEMMKQFGGEEGMAGLEGMGMDGLMGGADGKQDMAQLKESLLLLKQLKEAGGVEGKDVNDLKDNLKEMFGTSMEDIMKLEDREDITDEDREVVGLLKELFD